MVSSTVVPGRFTLVDALRGMAALAVVFYHAIEGNHIPALLAAMPAWLSASFGHGHLGVPVFFALSGFVISHAAYGQNVSAAYVGRFMLRRSIRLDPPYWFAIAVAISFAFLSAAVLKRSPPEVSAGQVFAHMFYLQDLLGFTPFNTVFWTLCIEVQFYLVYVVLLAVAGKHSSIALIIAAAVSLLWPLGLLPGMRGLFLPLWYGFLLGALAYWSWRERPLLPVFVAFAAIIIIRGATSGDVFALTCAITACVLSLSAMTGWLYTALNWRWLQFLGMISYSLYLLHNPITGASFRVGYMLTGHSLIAEIVWWIASVAACIIVAAVAWWLVERPSMVLARKIELRVDSALLIASIPAKPRSSSVGACATRQRR